MSIKRKRLRNVKGFLGMTDGRGQGSDDRGQTTDDRGRSKGRAGRMAQSERLRLKVPFLGPWCIIQDYRTY